jgi:CubicO group peptidase (beta-lactamase class C family)
VLLEKPSTVPGSKFEYSNVGYAIAGLMLEAATMRDWESLMVSNIFTPLGMSSANFATPLGDQLEQPIGHIRINRKLEPLQPGAEEDSPPALGPAGTVNCSIEDLLKFAASHVGESPLVSRPTLERLHRRYRASEWSPGWCVVDRTWSGGYALFHYGSNWGSIASMWLAPLKNLAFVAASNANTGQKACDAAINKLIARFLQNED